MGAVLRKIDRPAENAYTNHGTCLDYWCESTVPVLLGTDKRERTVKTHSVYTKDRRGVNGTPGTDLQCVLSVLFSDSLDSMGMCLCRVPNIPPLVPQPPPPPAAGTPASTTPSGSVGSGGSSVTANLTATAVVGVIVELISCSHGVDIRQPVANHGHAHLPRRSRRMYHYARGHRGAHRTVLTTRVKRSRRLQPFIINDYLSGYDRLRRGSRRRRRRRRRQRLPAVHRDVNTIKI